jgi:hypothetical protein
MCKTRMDLSFPRFVGIRTGTRRFLYLQARTYFYSIKIRTALLVRTEPPNTIFYQNTANFLCLQHTVRNKLGLDPDVSQEYELCLPAKVKN